MSILANTTDKDLKQERVVFKEVFDHRNRAVHFVPSDDVESVAAEQYRSWYYLHRLLDGPWKDVFSNHSDELEELDKSFRAHTACLGVRFDELKQANRFVAAAHRDALIIAPAIKYWKKFPNLCPGRGEFLGGSGSTLDGRSNNCLARTRPNGGPHER